MNDIKPIENKVVTKITTFGSKKNYIVIETVASFINYYNYINTPSYKTVVKNETQDTEIIPINYSFLDSPQVELIISQTKELILDGEKVSNITKEKIGELFSKEPDTYLKILEEIKNNSEEVDKGLKNKLKIF